MLDHVLEDILKVEDAGGDVETLRRSLAPIRTLAKDASIVAQAAKDVGASVGLFNAAKAEVRHNFRERGTPRRPVDRILFAFACLACITSHCDHSTVILIYV